MRHLTRRQLLAYSVAAGAAGALSPLFGDARVAWAAPTTTLRAGSRVIEVNGRAANVFGLTQPDGTHGLETWAGERFRVRLENHLDEETLIHWHGLTPPWQQDGVPDLSQPALAPGQYYDYDFPLDRPGTNWMHSHLGLQEQRLLAAPLIVRDPGDDAEDMQEVVVMFHDFTFRDPEEILAGLQGGGHGGHGGHGASNGHQGNGEHHAGFLQRMRDMLLPGGNMDHGAGHAGMDHGAGHGAMGAGMVHLHDVEYDAFLANDRTLTDPAIHRVERGGRVRLRLINAATATNFWIDLGQIEGELIAVDGMPIVPRRGRRFEFAIAQRLDIVLELPAGEGAWPVFAVREGERARTGIVLATPAGNVTRLDGESEEAFPAVGLELEQSLRAAVPLPPRDPDRQLRVDIAEAPGYVWTLNGATHGDHAPLAVREGERVEITFVDDTTMAHPMHLHGHHFQVVAVNGVYFQGAMRDTVLVPARGSVTIAFDATNPGKWALHCHHLYHMAGGMMTTVEYVS